VHWVEMQVLINTVTTVSQVVSIFETNYDNIKELMPTEFD